MKPKTIYKLGTLKAKDNDGFDYFAVLGISRKVSFHEMLQGCEVVDKASYDKVVEKLKKLKKKLRER